MKVIMGNLKVKAKTECKYDIFSLGEVMLRLDPGDKRIHTTREFQVWEGGFPVRTMYLATVLSATESPNSLSSDRIRGAPQVGFSRDICWIKSRTS